VLVISPTPVLPLLGGASARIRTLLDALATIGCEPHFAFLQRDPGDDDAMRALLGDRFHPIPYRWQPAEVSLGARLRRRLLQSVNLESGWLWDIDDIYDPAVDGPLAELQARIGFDVVIVEYIFFSRALRLFGPEVRKLVDMHDVFGNRHRMYLAAGQSEQWLSVRPADELRALRRADHAIAIQPDEARQIRERGFDAIDSVSHVVTIGPAPERVPADQSVLFVGSSNESNAHGLRWFIEKVWPSVRSIRPQATLHVAGAVGNGFASAPGVAIEGRVSDERLAELYRNACVAVNPVFTGSGQSIKVLEATGLGVPVVASTVGIRGIVGVSEPGVHVANDPASFARALTRILCDSDYALRARRSAHAFAVASNAAQLETLSRLAGVTRSEAAADKAPLFAAEHAGVKPSPPTGAFASRPVAL
jgi:glycosyltransferase involved in cell wall biosynthesis